MDRLARTVISISGLGIICAVLGIGLFLLLEIAPLLRGARVAAGPASSFGNQPALLTLLDEHQEKAVVVAAEPVVRVVDLGASRAPQVLPLAGIKGQQISAVSHALRESKVAFGTDEGMVWVGSIQLQTVFHGTQRTIAASVEPDMAVPAVPGHRITRLAYRETERRSVIAAVGRSPAAPGTLVGDPAAGGVPASVADDTRLIVTRITTQRPLAGPVRRSLGSLSVPLEPFGHPTALLMNGPCTQLLVATSAGLVARWRVPAEGPLELIETVQAVPAGAVLAMTYLIGERSIAVGGSDGSVATWSLVRDAAVADGWRLTPIHRFPSHRTGIAVISPSPRDKGFITISTEGAARLHYMTSERTLAEWSLGEAPAAADFAPKADGIVIAGASGTLHHWRVDNPHPELSWRALFGKLWYEGYDRPEYVWQSTGGADDFEPKLSLVPLIFGTLKGTFYALLFAVPLALFGALYCSQFLDKGLRNPVKSSIELMAALPSVVLGFIAGVVLAPLVGHHIVAVLSIPVLVPLVTVGGMTACSRIQASALRAALRRQEFWLLMVWVAVGLVVCVWLAPWIERALFSGDFEGWLLRTAGIRYDQRNALVVGWVMGFAVIPIIFTICEDAFSSVPRHLVGASLACGATLWQTAWRVVLPAAGSGVFSGIMIGFGRAVGETMIVLMATGNTPVLDWSLFNGFRALSANVAVEIPEAPYGGTLYRVLFVSSLLLFAMTSVVNTAAELIRSRLRARLKGL
jgi:phosphate transport system permease protein